MDFVTTGFTRSTACGIQLLQKLKEAPTELSDPYSIIHSTSRQQRKTVANAGLASAHTDERIKWTYVLRIDCPSHNAPYEYL